MDIITEDHRMVSARIRDGKRLAIRTHPKSPYAQLVVFDAVDQTEVDVIGTYPTREIAEKAYESLSEAHKEDQSPWNAYEFKQSLGLV